MRNIQDFIWFSSLGGSFSNGFLGLDWNDQIWVNAKFKCLEKWFRSFLSVMTITIYNLWWSADCSKKCRKIIQHGSCSADAPQPCPWPSRSPCPRSPRLCPEQSYHCYEVKPLVMKVLGVLYVLHFILPHEPVCSVKDRNDKEVEIDRFGLYTLPYHHCWPYISTYVTRQLISQMFFHLSPGKCLVNVALMLHEERKDHPGEGKHEKKP